jgi:hypothetical protein
LENEIQELTKQALEAEREAEYLKKQADKLEEEIESVTASKLIAQLSKIVQRRRTIADISVCSR